MYQIPKNVRVAVGVLCAIVAVSALAGGAAAIFLPEKPAWTAVGFELVTLISAGLGIVMATDKYRSGPGLALACIAGSILVAAGLGYLAGGSKGQAGDASVRLLLASRVLISFAMGLLAASLVLSRRKGQWKLAIHGAALLVAGPALGLLHRQTDGEWFTGPAGSSLGITAVALIALTVGAFVVAGAFAFIPSAPARDGEGVGPVGRAIVHLAPIVAVVALAAVMRGHVNAEVTGVISVARIVLSLFLVVFLGGWFCGGASMLIRAFEMGRAPITPTSSSVIATT
jgi:hypothetical protein